MKRASPLTVGAIAFGLIATIVVSVVAWEWALNVAPWRYGDTLIGIVDGVISSADRGSSVVRVASGLFGRTSVTLIVAPDTEIVVGDELGQFASLEAGRRLRAVYEVRPDGLIARYVDILAGSTDGGSRLGLPKRPRDAVQSLATVEQRVEPGATPSRSRATTPDEAAADGPRSPVASRRQRPPPQKRVISRPAPPPIVEHLTPPSADSRCPESPCPTASPVADSPPTSSAVGPTTREPIASPMRASAPPVEQGVVPPGAPPPNLSEPVRIESP